MAKKHPVEAKDTAAEIRKQKISDWLGRIETKFKDEDGKVTVSDYIRLIQLERELKDDDPPGEIKITWVKRQERSATDG
jgi:hypothetical protein